VPLRNKEDGHAFILEADMMKQWVTSKGTAIARIRSGRSNAYLISSRGRHVLVDTGKRQPIEQLARLIGSLDIAAIDAIILTHSHFDHAENAAALKLHYHAPIVIRHEDAAYLERGDSPVPPGSLWITHLLTTLFLRLVQPLLRYDPVSPDIRIQDGFDLAQFGISGRLLHTPGHSSGSMSVIVDDEIAIVGDAMMGVYPGSVFIPFADDVPEMIRSWKKLLETHCRIFLPGHGGAITAGLVKRQYEKFSSRYPV
jgi:hydroxyacylglutathione hydrolase